MRSFTICLIAITLVNISLLNFTFANENDGTITGTVRSGATKNIIPGITVAIPGTSIGTYTGTDGKFTINNSPIGVISVRFSGVGYETFVQTNVVVTHQKTAVVGVAFVVSRGRCHPPRAARVSRKQHRQIHGGDILCWHTQRLRGKTIFQVRQDAFNAARQLCINIYQRVAHGAQAFVSEKGESSVGELPAPVPLYYQRFGGLA